MWRMSFIFLSAFAIYQNRSFYFYDDTISLFYLNEFLCIFLFFGVVYIFYCHFRDILSIQTIKVTLKTTVLYLNKYLWMRELFLNYRNKILYFYWFINLYNVFKLYNKIYIVCMMDSGLNISSWDLLMVLYQQMYFWGNSWV